MPHFNPETIVFPVVNINHNGFTYACPAAGVPPEAVALLSTFAHRKEVVHNLFPVTDATSFSMNGSTDHKLFDLAMAERSGTNMVPRVNKDQSSEHDHPETVLGVKVVGPIDGSSHLHWGIYFYRVNGALAWMANRSAIPYHELMSIRINHPELKIEFIGPDDLSLQVFGVPNSEVFHVVARGEWSSPAVDLNMGTFINQVESIIRNFNSFFGVTKITATVPELTPVFKTLKIEDIGGPYGNMRFSLLGENGNVMVSYQGDPLFVMRKAIYWTQQQADARAATIQLQAWMNLAIQHSEDGNELQFIIGCNYNIPSAGTAMQFKLDKEICTTVEEVIAYVDTLERLGLAPRTQAVTFRRIFDRLSNFADPFHI